MKMTVPTLALAAAFTAVLAVAPVSAEMLAFKADLKGASEVPPTDSPATGTATVDVDTSTKEAKWTVQYSGMTGEATAAHIHGPAAVGENAGPAVDMSGKIESGSGTLTDAQLADLQAGKMYINIHSAKFPDGEIRGQLTK
jgi:hypothetical protein